MADAVLSQYMGFDEWVGKKVLIMGEAGTGKTRILARFLEHLILKMNPDEITVIDMAPRQINDVGGLMEDYTPSVWKVRYLRPWRVIPPRLKGETREEVLRYAVQNKLAIDPLIDEYLANPTPTLLINDITIYLHAGDIEKIKRIMGESETFTATAYSGVKLHDDKGSSITKREMESLRKLTELVDQVIRT